MSKRLLAMSFGLALVSGASAQNTWYVDGNGTPPGSGSALDPYTSVQYAIGQVATVSGDTLIVAPGTYHEVLDFVGKNLVVRSQAGATQTILRGNPSANPPSSVVTFRNGEGPSAQLIGFTVRDGNGRLQGGTTSGGGIYILNAAPTLIDLVLTNNQADLGGGVYSQISSLANPDATLLNCKLARNHAANGGGLYAKYAAPRLLSCAILGNTASASGGGVYLELSQYDEAPWDPTRCRFQRNVAQAGSGGGLYGAGAFVALTSCRFDDNTANAGIGGGACFADYGGGLVDGHFVGNSAGAGGAVSYVTTLGAAISRCEFRGNSGVSNSPAGLGGGGAVYAVNSPVSISDSTFFGNSVVWPWFAGAISVVGSFGFPADFTIVRCVLAENVRGCIRYVAGSSSSSGTAFECTVVNNVDGGIDAQSSNFLVSNCIVRDNGAYNVVVAPWGTILYSDVQGGAAGTGNIDADPLLWDPANLDFHLSRGSPCIDTGDPAVLDPDGSRSDMGGVRYSALDCLTPVVYCPGGTSANGQCTPSISNTGVAYNGAASGFTIRALQLPGERSGSIIYGLNGATQSPWGTTSYVCMNRPRYRTGVQNSGGTAGVCDGEIALDFNAWLTARGYTMIDGALICAQAWYRDPAAALGSNLSDAIRFTMCP
jgi:hypothetical protein